MRIKLLLMILFLVILLGCNDNEKKSLIQLANNVTDEQSQAYREIAVNFAKLNDFDSAIKYSEKISNLSKKDASYKSIISIMLEKGLFNEAFNLVDRIDNKYSAQKTYNIIFEKLIKYKNEYDKALKLSNKVSTKNNKLYTKRLILNDMLINNYDTALSFFNDIKIDLTYDDINRVIGSISYHFLKNNDYESLLKFMRKANIKFDNKNSEIIIKKAINQNKESLVINLFEFLDREQADMMNSMIAKNKIDQYNYTEANIYINRIIKTGVKDGVYLNYAFKYLNDNELGKALSFIDSINSVNTKDKLYHSIAGNYLRNNDAINALIYMNKINSEYKVNLLVPRVASKLLFSGEVEKYNEVYLQISDSDIKDETNRDIIQYLIKRNRYNEIDRYLEEMTEDFRKELVLEQIVISLNDKGLESKSKFYYDMISSEYVKGKLNELFK